MPLPHLQLESLTSSLYTTNHMKEPLKDKGLKSKVTDQDRLENNEMSKVVNF